MHTSQMWEYFFAHCLANQGQTAHASGPMAYSSFHKVSLNRPPDHMASPTWSSQNKWLDQLRNDSTDPTETSGGMLSTVDMVVQQHNGPRQLRDNDDDDDTPWEV